MSDTPTRKRAVAARRRADGALAPRGIELWCTFLEDIRDPNLWARYRALLTPAELTRQERLRFEKDRLRDLATRALVRTVLSRYAPVAPEEWRFAAGPHGRPRIAGASPPPLEFNVSHAHELVVVAVAARRLIGVDIEDLERRANTAHLDRYFAPGESAALRALPEGEQRRRFFELWTLKEAYLKATGVGLTQPLDSIVFELPGRTGLRLSSESAADAGDWLFAQFPLRERYLAAVCVQRRGAAPVALRVREAVPLEWERLIEVTVTRGSVRRARS